MNIKKILFAGLIALSLSACSDEENSPIDSNPGGIKGYLSLKVITPQTKASGDNTTQGTPEESQIHDITVALTDESGLILHVITPDLSGANTAMFQVELGSYKVYTLINNPVTGLTINQNIERVIGVAQAADAETGFNGGKFFMVNERKSSSEGAGVHVTVSAFNTESNPAIAMVNVDRVAVKIQDNTAYTEIIAPNGFPGTITSLRIDGFALLNMNKKFNMIQTWGDENLNGDPLSAGSEVLQTPLYTAGSGLIKDQYYKNISEYILIEKDGTTGEAIRITDLTKSNPEAYKLGSTYTTENRPTIMFFGDNKLTAGRGETTGVIYKVQAMTGGNAANTFYMYNNKFYLSLSELQALNDFKGITLAENAPELRAKGIKVFENGVIYYTYFIVNTNSSHQYGGQNYYGVFRNSIYNMSVISINKIGDDIPGGSGIDPDSEGETANPPISAEEAYISVNVTVNPWVINDIGIDF